jgi:hypothetical protein
MAALPPFLLPEFQSRFYLPKMMIMRCQRAGRLVFFQAIDGALISAFAISNFDSRYA